VRPPPPLPFHPAADVFINFANDSVINVTTLGGFCDSQSIGSLNCHHTLAANKSEDLPNPDFKYVNLALAFNHVVDCGATKAEVIANNPDWYDIMDVSVVDGFNNKIEIDATEHGKMPVKLGDYPARRRPGRFAFSSSAFCICCAFVRNRSANSWSRSFQRAAISNNHAAFASCVSHALSSKPILTSSFTARHLLTACSF
jgi:hypothetical protein